MTGKNAESLEFPFTLRSKNAIVTRGGRGIGRAVVQRLASTGANVLVCDLDREALQETKSSVRNPERVAVSGGHVVEPACPQQIVDAALGTFGSIDIVNSDGFICHRLVFCQSSRRTEYGTDG